MNKKVTQFDLIQRCFDENPSDEELYQLEDLLRNDPEFRKDYLSYINVDSALSTLPTENSEFNPPVEKIVTPNQWRPLVSSAAAGLIFGLFCATIAWAIVVPEKPSSSLPQEARVITPIITESFEKPTTPFKKGFPSQANVWGGDRVEIVQSTPRTPPFDGNSALTIEASPRFKMSYLLQILDVSSAPQANEGEMRIIEVISSFLADQPGEKERYTIHIASFKESPEEIRELREGITPTEIDELTLTFSKRGLSTSRNAEGWQTLSAMVEVPSDAHSVVISLGAGRLFRKSERTAHYIDDIRAELRIIPFSERLSLKH